MTIRKISQQFNHWPCLLFLKTNTLSLTLFVLRCTDSRCASYLQLGRDDRSHRVPRGTCGGLRADGHAGHQKSTQVSKQSPTGEFSPDITPPKPLAFHSRLIGHSFFFFSLSSPFLLVPSSIHYSLNPILIFVVQSPRCPFFTSSPLYLFAIFN